MSVTISGIQVVGRGDGTRLGFPTINLDTQNISPDLYGVWFSYCNTKMHKSIPSITHIGPSTLFNQIKATVEVHILDWDDAYGAGSYNVELLELHRTTKDMSSEQELIQEISADVASAKQFFSRLHT
ncbi:MAG: riboflavin kinase [Patescibacteria group bacterium]